MERNKIIERILQLKEEIKSKYIDCDGFVCLTPNCNVRGDNGLLFTSEYMLLCYLFGVLDDYDIKNYVKLVNNCRRVVDGVPIDGLYNRNPGRDDRIEEHDDYDGITAVSYLLCLNFHKDVYNYGKSNYWYYNNVNPGKFTINGKFSLRPFRLPHVIAYYKFLNHKFVGLFGWLFFIANLIISTFGIETSSKLLNWIRLEALSRKGFVFSWIKRLYIKVLSKKFNGFDKIFSIYFPQDHPFVEMAKYYFQNNEE